MFRRRRQKKLNNWLGLLLKILLIAGATVQLIRMVPDGVFSKKQQKGELIDNLIENDTLTNGEMANDENLKGPAKKDNITVTPNSVSIYIFGNQGLETQLIQQLGKTYFYKYRIKAKSGYNKEALLVGDLSSSASTELVSVGSAAYTYYENSLGQISCEALLEFTTYRKTTGEVVRELSRSISKTGPGNTRSKAKEQALKRIREELAIASPTS